MLVVDSSSLYEVLTDGPQAESTRTVLDGDEDHAAPHIVDVEVFGVIRRHLKSGRLDTTAARQALADLADWSGERFAHRGLLPRMWELRDWVRGWDAAYVALAEALSARLVTLDNRLARAHGLRCEVFVPPA